MDNFTEPLVQIVDKQGIFQGVAGKIEAHLAGRLHLAFSVMCYRQGANETEYLLQQRAMGKYHSGGLWSNTCCSHPAPGENLESAVNRRLFEEVGMVNNKPFEHLGTVIYHFELDNNMAEHEYDHVFLVEADKAVFSLNSDEVTEVQWFSHTQLQEALQKYPERFTKWFPLIWNKIQTHISEQKRLI